MKIAWVNPSFLDYRVPVYANLNALTEGNLHIIYSASRTPTRVHCKITKELGYNAVPLHFEKSIYFGNQKSDFSNKNYRIPFPQHLYSHLRRIKPEIIIAEGFFQWTLYALIYSIVHRRKIYIAYERTKYTERNCGRLRTLYRKIVSRFAAGFIVNGELTKEYCVETLGIKSEKIVTKCMSAGVFSDISIPKNQKKEDVIRFLFVGQLNERKGLREFLSIVRTNSVELRKSIQINIIGSGPEYLDLVRICQESNMDFVNFIGSVDHDEISKHYLANDVFFLPTLEDNWSLVIPEAMAHKRPVATTPYNGCSKELIKHKANGYIFDINNDKSVMEMIRFFISNQNEFESMGELSFEIQSDFSAEKVSKRIYNFIANKCD